MANATNPTPAGLYDAIVVGGGISGLATAWRLIGDGLRVCVVEKFRRLGGVIYSRRVEGPGGEYLVEQGPNSFANRPSDARDLLVELGLAEQIVERPAMASKRYLFDGKALRAVPMGPISLLATPLLSLGAKARLLMEPFRGGVAAPASDGGDDLSLGAWIESHFGRELLDGFATPLVGGIYAANPEAISLASTFPALQAKVAGKKRVLLPRLKKRTPEERAEKAARRRAPRSMMALRDGNEELIRALAAKIEAAGGTILLNAHVDSWRRDEAADEVALALESGVTIRGRRLVASLPALSAANLLGENLPELADCLLRIDYAPMTVASIAAKREAFGRPLDGFGFLVPRERGVRLLGSVWNSAMFPGRAPEGHEQLTCFLGGQLDPEASNLDDEALAELLRAELGKCFGLGAPLACDMINVRRWPRALPIFHVGYPALMKRIAAATPPWLTLASNYMEAISVPECVRKAGLAAKRVAASLRGRESAESDRRVVA
jgi:oxygen-dependent protoporphyrinogen oxidase